MMHIPGLGCSDACDGFNLKDENYGYGAWRIIGTGTSELVD